MKRVLFVFAAGLLWGCAGVRVTPAAREVRTVALVGLSASRPFRNTQPSEKSQPLTLKSLVNPTEDVFLLEEAGLRDGVLLHARDALFKALSSVPGWEVLPYADLAARPAFQSALADGSWAPPERLMGPSFEAVAGFLPADTDEISGGVIFENGHRRKPREALAKLAGDLGVDAVAVVRLDLAYTLTGTVLWGVLQGHPDVAASMVLVTKGGELALNASHLTRQTTQPMGLIRREKGLVNLSIEPKDYPAKAAKAYDLVLGAAAADLAEEVSRKLSEKK
jgi:hypothetical protein